MPQTTDIALDGAGYMLLPGAYQRSQDGIAEGRTGRIVMQDFFGGQHRALQLERDRGWGGIGTGPALDGQGVVPWPHITAASLPATAPLPGSYVASLLDGGERDKAWRKVGALFTALEPHGNGDSADPVTVALDWSADAGATWQVAATRTLAATDANADDLSLEAGIASDTAVSRWAQLRVRWESVSDWAPVLTGLWAEFEVMDAPARRRSQLGVLARDQVVRRDGGMLPRSGRDLIAEPWSAWESCTTLPFRDIDHDTDPTERRVRIVSISERVARPAEASETGDALIELTLVVV